jgi:hypothetical protein
MRIGLLVTSMFALGSVCCQSPAIVRTARTLPAGGGDISFSVNITRISTNDLEVDGMRVPGASYTYPSTAPELLVAYGLVEDLELDARLAFATGLLEAGVKYRFLHLDGFHAAAAPSAGYRALGIVNGPIVTLPLLLTYDFNESIALSGGPLLAYASYDVLDAFEGADNPDIGGDTIYAGGALGLELRAGKFHILPSVELQRSVSRTGAAAELPPLDLLFLSVTAGFGSR